MQNRSMAMQHRPEYQLSSQSPVLTAKFHPFDTHVIIGGTYSGQVPHGAMTIHCSLGRIRCPTAFYAAILCLLDDGALLQAK